MNTDTTPVMPMPAAGKLPLGPSTLPPSPLPLPPMPGGPPMPPAAGAPLPLPATPAPMGATPMAVPAPTAPTKPPYDVQIQADGSSIYTIPGPDGSPIVIGHNAPPKLPKALQPAKA